MLQKLRTGNGQHIEISMQEVITYYMWELPRLAHGRQLGQDAGLPQTQLNNSAAPSVLPLQALGLPLCRPDRRRAAHGKFFMAIDRPDLARHERFATDEARLQHARALHAEVEKLQMRPRMKHEVMRELGACAATMDTVDVYDAT